MIRGGCLCGTNRFEVNHFAGPFELCHCSRCRKASGSAFTSMIGVKAKDFSWTLGGDEIVRFEATVLERPPGFRTAFCAQCGSPMPVLEVGDDWFEVAAGTLDDDPGLRPDRHIFVECKCDWYEIRDDQPQLTKKDVIRMRVAEWKRNRHMEGN